MVFTIAIGYFIGKFSWELFRVFLGRWAENEQKKLQERYPERYGRSKTDAKPKEPIGFKQYTVKA